VRIRFQNYLFKADRRIRAHLVALVSKPALAKSQGPVLKMPVLLNCDFGEVLKLGRLFGTCPF
jgi:hypothetical protein